MFLSALGMAALALSSASFAKADVLTFINLSSIVGNQYTYTVDLVTPQELLSGASGAQFGTLYNVDGTVTATTGLLATSAFRFSTGNFASTPALGQPSVGLVAGNTDIRYTFNPASATIPEPTAGVTVLGTFTVTAAAGAGSVITSYDGSAYNATNSLQDGNSGPIIAPSTIPEPISMSLLGGGLALLGLVRLRRK